MISEGSNESDEKLPRYASVPKGEGVTHAEQYLGRLCQRTFLSLWSYQCLYRDQGKPIGRGHGKEICDLLVVFDEHIIVFSDKHCAIQDSGDAERDWQRWFKKAIQKSAEQAWGAERWIRQNPNRVFLDRECTKQLPIPLPEPGTAKFHLVVVAHGISGRIMRFFPGGSGSLLINTRLMGFEQHVQPFRVGDLDPQKGFVHVLDDVSLNILMRERDTISDFVAYLSKREKLLRGPMLIHAPGEEELLPFYLRNLNECNEHDFVFPLPRGESFTDIAVPEGCWDSLQNEPKRIEQQRQNQISYSWDALIEKFAFYALRGEQHYASAGGLNDCERVLRFMAREPRWKRRYLARTILEMVDKVSPNQRMLRVLTPMAPGDPYWVFLLLPVVHAKSYEEYREVRRSFLEACCGVVKVKHPDAKDIVGIATESGRDFEGRSEDAIYLDARVWTAEMDEFAREDQRQLEILTREREFRGRAKEYPDLVPKMKNPRNKPCPCGSGRKYKHCCLDR